MFALFVTGFVGTVPQFYRGHVFSCKNYLIFFDE